MDPDARDGPERGPRGTGRDADAGSEVERLRRENRRLEARLERERRRREDLIERYEALLPDGSDDDDGSLRPGADRADADHSDGGPDDPARDAVRVVRAAVARARRWVRTARDRHRRR